MSLVINQLYEFLIGMSLGVGLSFFYACYRLQFHSYNYSRRWLWLADSLWWLFAAVVTVGALFFLNWGAIRVLFFLWLFLGFFLGYRYLWRPLCHKIVAIFSGRPKPPISPDGSGFFHSPKTKLVEQAAHQPAGSFLQKPFDLAAEGIYQSYAYSKQHYIAAKKKQQAATEKWKKQLQAGRQRLKHKVLAVLWPEQKRAEEDGSAEDYSEMDMLDAEDRNNFPQENHKDEDI